MKLLFAIVQDDDANKLMSALNKKGIQITKLSSTGGFLKSGNTTLITCIEDQRINEALSIIESKCKSRSAVARVSNNSESDMAIPMTTDVNVNVGGATVFITNIEDFRKF